jgi:hypothetical protein
MNDKLRFAGARDFAPVPNRFKLGLKLLFRSPRAGFPNIPTAPESGNDMRIGSVHLRTLIST